MDKTFNLPTNRLYQKRGQRLKSGRKIIDLVSGNVNAGGLHFPPAALRQALTRAQPKAKDYRPDPLGQKAARQAICRWYASEGLAIPPEQIILTPGTSIGYWYAFKLLADAGDEILAPAPSYPLFDSIAALCGVKLAPYHLRESQRWEIDFADLEAAVTSRTKAIILISPHNPTGAVASGEEIEALVRIARGKNLPIISDEVFGSFLFKSKNFPRPASTDAPLVLTLNGFSKMFALPGLKLGWMAVTGEKERVTQALRLLEMISDTFLPVNEIVQAAVPALFQSGKPFLKPYRLAIQERHDLAVKHLRDMPGVSFCPPEGGFYVTLKLERGDEEAMACGLLEKEGILVHPGYFYDMEGRHLVLSFAGDRRILGQGLASFQRYLEP